ncbi:MAG: hypothetical protein IT289_13535, partial [Oligoflexia bacterium]|nr:hypothetical protein [Oligoflexia bacterium]
MTASETKWPKTIPELSAEQAKIRQDFMKLWHEILPAKYGVMEDINHRYALLEKPGNGVKTLEIGAGLGAHLEYENLTIQDYTANELRPQFAERIQERFPGVKTVVGDIQPGLDLPEAS